MPIVSNDLQQNAARRSRSSHVHRQTKPDEVIALLDEWLADKSGYDDETWPELKGALDRDRLSSRNSPMSKVVLLHTGRLEITSHLSNRVIPRLGRRSAPRPSGRFRSRSAWR